MVSHPCMRVLGWHPCFFLAAAIPGLMVKNATMLIAIFANHIYVIDMC